MRTLAFLNALLLLFSLPALGAGKPVGSIKTYQPEAVILRQGVEFHVGQGVGVYVGDTILTRSNGAVGITFVDGSVLSLGPTTEFVIDDFRFEPDLSNVSFLSRIQRGTATFLSGAIGRISPQSVKFKTPTATLGLRGTKVLIKVD